MSMDTWERQVDPALLQTLVTLVQQLSRNLSAPVLLKLHYPAIHTNDSVWNCSIFRSSNLVIIN